MKKLLLLVLVGLLAFSSCKKDPVIDDNPPIDNTRNFNDIVTSVVGVVVDRNNVAIEDALVEFGQETAMTDENGVFRIDNATVRENRAFVKVTKDGYFHGSRTYFAHANQRSQVRIHLLEKTIQGSINSSGGNVTLPEGVKLDFPADAVANADGTPYTGTVQVAAQYLDPTANDLNFIMPGDLRGITTENVEEGLSSYGMVAVELIGSGGELLNVADGKTVTLTMPVASTQSSVAPSEIPLWFFDEVTGVWMEEGVATLQGGEYVGEVSHFTFWNCDVNWDLIYLDGSVLLEGAAYEGALVCLTFDNGNGFYTACDYTNEMGLYSGKVPTNTTFEITVHSNGFNCSNSFYIYTGTIGPYTADATVDAINIDPASIAVNSLDLTGMIVDCDNNAITNGYVIATVGNNNYYVYTTDGTIDGNIIHCATSGDITIKAIDYNNAKQSDPASYPFTNAIDFGTLQACEQLDAFININLDGQTYTMIWEVIIYDSTATGSGVQTINGFDDNQSFLFMTTNGNAIGTYDALNFNFSFLDPNNPNSYITIASTDVDITFTQYSGVVGETCIGTFDGTVPLNGVDTPISGSFKTPRQF